MPRLQRPPVRGEGELKMEGWLRRRQERCYRLRKGRCGGGAGLALVRARRRWRGDPKGRGAIPFSHLITRRADLARRVVVVRGLLVESSWNVGGTVRLRVVCVANGRRLTSGAGEAQRARRAAQ